LTVIIHFLLTLIDDFNAFIGKKNFDCGYSTYKAMSSLSSVVSEHADNSRTRSLPVNKPPPAQMSTQAPVRNSGLAGNADVTTNLYAYVLLLSGSSVNSSSHTQDNVDKSLVYICVIACMNI